MPDLRSLGSISFFLTSSSISFGLMLEAFRLFYGCGIFHARFPDEVDNF